MEKKHNSFFQPQRQSKTGIVLLFLYNIGMVIKNLWVFVILFFVNKDRVNSWIVIVAIITALLILIASSILKYYYFTYYIDAENEEFVIHEGIINRSVTKIKKKIFRRSIFLNLSFIGFLISTSSKLIRPEVLKKR